MFTLVYGKNLVEMRELNLCGLQTLQQKLVTAKYQWKLHSYNIVKKKLNSFKIIKTKKIIQSN